MSRPLIRSGQWSQTTAGILQPAARLTAIILSGVKRKLTDSRRSFVAVLRSNKDGLMAYDPTKTFETSC